MVEVTFAQLQGWLVAFLWPFARITAFMAASPLWGHSSVPNQAKVGLAALIAIVIAPILPAMPDIAVMSWAGVGIMIEQILIGLAMGLVMHIMFAVVQAAGDFIGLQMGLAFASFFDASSGTNIMVLSRILYMITLLMFLAMNGHLMVLETLIMSFQTLPIGIGTFNPDAFILLSRYAGTIFASGMLLALPLVGSLLTINLALGILNRSAPQLTVFNIGFPTSLIVGLILMMVLMTDINRFLQRLFTQGLEFMQTLIETMAPLN
ncbi:flagellar biosynthetic protein FliR [Halomonas sp. ATBC28]|jgi:flagellar biosynthesis protein FliR|uniref:flagellar biosynthetic protein FliR n=1 Tax=Halomonadaceae TaxID=28256 RepID=UPI000488FEF8|nr:MULTISPECIES: flagellar biosynthetic protein FliR [unclassified Halomonas]NAO98886.1 flagellar biosynthetic protein FliR [Halomonas sp. MG34]KIN13149.1 flagellar biosynthesis protein FliR [Halomonas sp. KHS3]MCD1587915.1 flagellar biosynthetic protein FliR [Halomonas sp. IOP_14]PKH62330.1 flagellar biosynthetic protein FliR [Halomonas sp. Choline-3u-9]TMU17863.1 flagellar biosynthetic protein FliR [Halomonas sp. ATBC28]